ncbi:MAG: diguanylate cyclase [Spirochaetaceae bacterium]
MSALTEKFNAQLPERLYTLQGLLDRVLEDPENDDLRFEARMAAHKIAGGAGTFGLEKLGRLCVSLEVMLDQDQIPDGFSQAMAMLRDMTDGFLDSGNVTELVDALEELPENDAPPAPAVSAVPEERILVLGQCEDDSDNLVTLCNDFGLQAAYLPVLEDVRTHLDHPGPLVLCADIERVKNEDANSLLSELAETAKDRFAWVALSKVDDFNLRLEAVRRGAREFVTRPVDVAQLLDKVRDLALATQPDPIHVLIVDDDVDQVSATAYTLQQAGMITSVASDPRQVFSIMVESKPELVIMDMYMPDCNGIELSRLIRQQESFVGIPIIFLSVEADGARHIDAMSEGGDDFLVKPVLPEYLTAKVRMRAQRARDMRFFMEHDSLTGLLNHSNLKQRLEDEIQRAARVGSELTLAMIDIDHFKSVNDTYGHLTGDRVLKTLSRMLQDRLRKTDTIGRYGGEEFGVILFNASIAEAHRIMDDLREAFSRVIHHSLNGDFQVTFSCGLASYPDIADGKLISDTADKALYRAKESGRNRVVAG